MLVAANDFFIPEFSESVTYNATVYRAIQSDVTEDIRIAEGGLDLGDEMSLVVDFATPIPEGATITYQATLWRVARCVADSASVTKRLYLIHPFGGGA